MVAAHGRVTRAGTGGQRPPPSGFHFTRAHRCVWSSGAQEICEFYTILLERRGVQLRRKSAGSPREHFPLSSRRASGPLWFQQSQVCKGEGGGRPRDSRSVLRTSPNLVSVLGKLDGSSRKTLHWVAVLALSLSLCASLLSSAFTFYNSVSNPYQTFLGPVGVYTWSGLGGERPRGPGAPLPLSLCLSGTRVNTHDHGRAWKRGRRVPGRPPRAAVQFRKPAALIKRLWKSGSVLSALVSGQERSEEGVVGAHVSGTRQSLLWGS